MEPFLWSKVFDFSFPTIKKILSLIFKIMLIVGIPALILWGSYVLFVKPHTNPNPTTEENAQVIYHFTINVPAKRVFGFGGTLWGTDIGVVKYDFTSITATIIKEVVKIDPTINSDILVSKINDKITKEIVKTKQKKWYFLWLF